MIRISKLHVIPNLTTLITLRDRFAFPLGPGAFKSSGGFSLSVLKDRLAFPLVPGTFNSKGGFYKEEVLITKSKRRVIQFVPYSTFFTFHNENRLHCTGIYSQHSQ